MVVASFELNPDFLVGRKDHIDSEVLYSFRSRFLFAKQKKVRDYLSLSNFSLLLRGKNKTFYVTACVVGRGAVPDPAEAIAEGHTEQDAEGPIHRSREAQRPIPSGKRLLSFVMSVPTLLTLPQAFCDGIENFHTFNEPLEVVLSLPF
jgi:hypothetical protein